MSESKTGGVALAPGEATLSVKVYRTDGTVEEHQGSELKIDLTELITEYKRAVLYVQQLEAVMSQIPELKQRMK